MPELPEVENARRCLVRAGLPGRSFTGADIGWAKAVKTPALEEFVLGLRGSRALDVHRRGKYILAPLLDDEGRDKTFILHLGMTGGLGVYPKSSPADPMVRHTFLLDDGDDEMRFVDGRKFGKLWLVDDPAEVLPPLSPEPLDGGLTTEWLAESLEGRKVPIKGLLLEQSVVAGMGNIYADESLLLAKISPLRMACDLSSREIEQLQQAIVAALTYGVSVYDKARDEMWPDPPRALTGWTISRADGASCPRCTGPFAAIRVRGRGTYYCPNCQR